MIFLCRMADGGKDYNSKFDETDSDDFREEFSEDDYALNLRKRIKRFFSVVVLMYASDCQTEFPGGSIRARKGL